MFFHLTEKPCFIQTQKTSQTWKYNFVYINIQVSREETIRYKIQLYGARDKIVFYTNTKNKSNLEI